MCAAAAPRMNWWKFGLGLQMACVGRCLSASHSGVYAWGRQTGIQGFRGTRPCSNKRNDKEYSAMTWSIDVLAGWITGIRY